MAERKTVNLGADGIYEVEFPDFLNGGVIWCWRKVPADLAGYHGFIPESRHVALFRDRIRDVELHLRKTGKPGLKWVISFESGCMCVIPVDQIENVLFPTRDAAEKARPKKTKVVDPNG